MLVICCPTLWLGVRRFGQRSRSSGALCPEGPVGALQHGGHDAVYRLVELGQPQAWKKKVRVNLPTAGRVGYGWAAFFFVRCTLAYVPAANFVWNFSMRPAVSTYLSFPV